ncbi:hypothetical protein BCR41DRAFT_65731 [Lobosporangium transversale]|uniref:Nucleoporin Nup159/Nup146 N-terminal domain-containing protein n=1 Tax=Lobosporangium transversale TaxID=64571 RepID=A0A1Y2GNX1_9FUNG|nr:hypothetical protein BCR41DRAFT_65731 [Lobosporangium transversale]ORZ15554.1 hypothetical protein BCR41DRAFT_65731 [Lobosporangium transversale]|eukprot:XP_021881302.1 hypothetical protein BCR41DRAFT_65731 [Lobosporangium transversale]
MAWSAKGKQIMCGTDTGVLQQIDPEGVVKKEHQPNPENEGKMVVGINWIETAVFIAVYCVPPADDNDTPEYDVCVISKEVPSSPKYQTFGDICFAMPQEGAGSVYFMTPSIKSWGGEFKELITVASSPSMDVVGIGRGSDGDWKKWDLDDTKRATVPGFDSICLGLGLDLTSTAALEPLEEDGPAVQPCPIIYIYTHLGALAAFHILNLQAAKTGAGCPAMVKPADLPESAPKPKASPSATKATVAAPIAATKATAAIPTAAAPTASAGAFGSISKTPVSPFATTAATGSPLSKSTIATPPLQQLKPAGLQKMNFGAPSPLSNPPTTSFAPNPAVTPNPSFQQAKPAASTTTSVRPSPSLQQNKAPAPKQPGIMQKLLQEDKPLKIIRKKSQSEESSAPAPKVSAAMDALSRQLENTYLAMTEELRTLSSHVKETEELIKARELVFEELDQFMRVTTKRIKAASDAKALAESVYKDFVQLRADLIKATTKKDEIGRLLRARQDPNLHDMLQYNELNPAQLSQQARMKASFEVVDKRLVELEDYVETLSLKATRLRQGHDFEGPTLDSIRRAIWNISHTLLQRQDDLDQLSRALDDFSISGSLNPTRDRSKKVSVKESATPNPRASLRGSVALSSMVDQRPITKIKNEMAQALKRVLTRDARVKPIFTSLSQNGPGGTLSMIPRTQAPEFIPAPEPRRAEAKKRLSAVISPPSEQQAVTTPAADATLPAFPSPGFASPGFASPGFASPGFAATSQSFQSPTTAMDAPKAFTGFQVPTPFKAPQNTPPAFGFAETLSQQRYEEKDYEEAFKDGNAQDEQEHYEGEEEEEEEEEEEDEEVEEEEGEEEEEQARSNERYTHYVHDGQEYELEEGSEPETWDLRLTSGIMTGMMIKKKKNKRRPRKNRRRMSRGRRKQRVFRCSKAFSCQVRQKQIQKLRKRHGQRQGSNSQQLPLPRQEQEPRLMLDIRSLLQIQNSPRIRLRQPKPSLPLVPYLAIIRLVLKRHSALVKLLRRHPLPLLQLHLKKPSHQMGKVSLVSPLLK